MLSAQTLLPNKRQLLWGMMSYVTCPEVLLKDAAMGIPTFLKGFNLRETSKAKNNNKTKNYTQQTLAVLLKYEFLMQLC